MVKNIKSSYPFRFSVCKTKITFRDKDGSNCHVLALKIRDQWVGYGSFMIKANAQVWDMLVKENNIYILSRKTWFIVLNNYKGKITLKLEKLLIEYILKE